MMACYQTGCSLLGLPTLEETFENDSRLKFSSNTIIFITYNLADFFFFLVLHNIDRCDLLHNEVPNIDPNRSVDVRLHIGF